MTKFIVAMIVVCSVALARPALAQQTTGNISGRIVDAQGAAVPGVTVTGRHTQTGFTRTDVSDAEGVYRLSALPVGTYDLSAELQGFNKVDHKAITVNVGQSLDIAMTMTVAGVSETVTVTGDTPLIETRSSSVGGVVDVGRIENLPLNGRQFANLAATIPGVGLGFHSDPTKSTQFSPQIGGGNGRNVNYQIDGGDNNDDTVGGLLQLFPLEAIQEFNFVTQRYKAEYGRSNGGVMNIVTKSGTNQFSGSGVLALPRQVAQLADPLGSDQRRREGRLPAVSVRRIVRRADRAQPRVLLRGRRADAAGHEPGGEHARALPRRGRRLQDAVPRDAADRQADDHAESGAVPGDPLRPQQQHAALRGGAAQRAELLEHEQELLRLDQREPQLGAQRHEAQRDHRPVRRRSRTTSRSAAPAAYELFPNSVAAGANPNTPQKTEQTKWQFRDDFSWSVTGMGGLGHDFKTGVNFINEPHLFATFNSGVDDYFYTHLTDERDGPIQTITRNGGVGDVNIPFRQYSTYVQDDWRVSDRLTLNLGLRYDLVTGVQIDQSRNPNFQALQEAGRAGRFNGVDRARGFREGASRGPQQHPAARGLRLRRARDRHGRHPRRMGRVPGFRLHELERALRGDRRRRASATGRSSRSTTRPGSGRPTGRCSASAIRFPPSRARTRRTRRGFRCSARSGRRGWSSPTRGRRTSGGRIS